MAPRIRKTRQVAANPLGPQGFVASAMQVATKQQKIRRAFKREEWQDECWDHFDNIGEYRYAQTWLAMAGSRADLVVETKDPATGEWSETKSGPAADYLNELLDSCGGKSQFLYTMFLHLGVPGESFIIGQDVLNSIGNVIGYRWRIVEAGELDLTSTPPTVTDPHTNEKEPIGEGALIIRVWRPHPRDAGRADSPSHAVLGPLREINHIGKHIGATVDSRLAGNGLLLLPKEVSITTADGTTTDGNANADGKDPFMQVFVQTIVAAINDRDDPSAVAPVIARMPGEHIQHVRHITFGTQFDAQALPLRDSAVKRLALGLELPPEQLLGLGDSNHWSAWQIEESGVKTGIEPPLQLIVDALTRQYLTPLLRVTDGADETLYRVAYRVDKLILRPNRSADAKDMAKEFAISHRAWREAAGFEETDAPKPDELKVMLAIRLIESGRADQVLGNLLGLPPGSLPDVPIAARPAGVASDEAPTSPPALPATDAADRPAPGGADSAPGVQSSAALLAACEPLVLRALERAGSKLRTRADMTRLAAVPLHETHLHLQVDDPARLLTGAWSLAASIAALHGVDPAELVDALDGFTGALLTHRRAYGRAERAGLQAGLITLTGEAAA